MVLMIGKILFDIPLSMLLLYLQELDTEPQILDYGGFAPTILLLCMFIGGVRDQQHAE